MIITQTPLRLSLLGGNTDFPKYFRKYGGLVLTTTIDKYIYCIVKRRFDNEIRVNYSIKEIVTEVDDIKHELVRETLRMTKISKGIEITFLSDIPSEGSGLGSSSAVTIGLLHALHIYKNESVTARQLAEEACKIEVDILKKPIGYQDQYAIAFGGCNLITFNQEIDVSRVNIVDPEELMLFYTGITRKAESVLKEMKLNKQILDKNKQLVKDTWMGKPLSQALYDYWELKKELNPRTTNRKIDNKYKEALSLGATSGKIVGAGGGGFLLLTVPVIFQKNVRENLGLRELPFELSNYGSRVIFNIT